MRQGAAAEVGANLVVGRVRGAGDDEGGGGVLDTADGFGGSVLMVGSGESKGSVRGFYAAGKIHNTEITYRT